MFVGKVDTIVLPIISIDNGWSPFVTSTEAVRACPEQSRRAEQRGLPSKQIPPLRPDVVGTPVGMTLYETVRCRNLEGPLRGRIVGWGLPQHFLKVKTTILPGVLRLRFPSTIFAN